METSIRDPVRVGIIGVGNCASSFVQGLSYDRYAAASERVPGLMNWELGGYHVADIEISSAFDVSARKVGRDVAEAILAEPNNSRHFANVPATHVSVQILQATGTHAVLSYLPVGSQHANEWYAARAGGGMCLHQ